MKFKKAVLMVAGAAAKNLGTKLGHEQEIVMNIADMIIETYAAESVLLRTVKLSSMKGKEKVGEQIEMMHIYIHEAADKINQAAKDALYAFASGDELRMMTMGLKRFTKLEPFNKKEARRKIADKLLAENVYCF